MIYLFLLGAVLYSLSAVVSYHPALKNSNLLYVYGIGIALVCNAIWLTIAKNTIETTKLALYGLYWDTIINLSFLAIPLLFFGASFSKTQGIGVLLILVGILITKI